MQLGINTRLHGATLIEALVAMIIISFTLGISAMIYMNVTNNVEENVVLQAISLIDQHRTKCIEENAFLDTEIRSGNMEVIIRSEQKDNGLVQMSYRAIFKKSVIYEKQYLLTQ